MRCPVARGVSSESLSLLLLLTKNRIRNPTRATKATEPKTAPTIDPAEFLEDEIEFDESDGDEVDVVETRGDDVEVLEVVNPLPFRIVNLDAVVDRDISL